jgi:hypothetical protein
MGWTGWMQHCVEMQKIFQSGQGLRSFYIFRPGFESAKKVSNRTESELMNYIQDTQRIYTTE